MYPKPVRCQAEARHCLGSTLVPVRGVRRVPQLPVLVYACVLVVIYMTYGFDRKQTSDEDTHDIKTGVGTFAMGHAHTPRSGGGGVLHITHRRACAAGWGFLGAR